MLTAEISFCLVSQYVCKAHHFVDFSLTYDHQEEKIYLASSLFKRKMLVLLFILSYIFLYHIFMSSKAEKKV